MIAFVGTPNCGKSTIFNALTGLHQKVGNFPGVTVEPKTGKIPMNSGAQLVIDLPGIYSFSPKSSDEELTVSVLEGRHSSIEKPNLAFFVIDGTNLEKGLFLFSQFAELQIPTVIIVTMIDSIQSNGGFLDDILLERECGTKVIGVVGHRGIGLDDIKGILDTPEEFLPARIQLSSSERGIDERYSWARHTAQSVANIPDGDSLTRKIDAVVLHPVAGPILFVLVMGLFFQSIFSWATPLMDGMEAIVSITQDYIASVVSAGLLQNFLVKGVLGGVGSVVVFLPQIIILYLFISVLEDFGYLARAAFLVDRFMGIFGLQGRSFIPLLSSFACAIPGIMSARIIPSKSDRIATILASPLMTCSARLPVYVLLITAFFPDITLWGIFNLRGLILMSLYAVGGISGLIAAKVFKSTLLKGRTEPFLMELPPYRFPAAKSIFLTILNRAKIFLTSAGTTILTISLILWALSEFPQTSIPEGTSSVQAAHLQLENSALAKIGQAIQPLFAPLGFDWKITVGVLGSFAAREVFVSVMGQVYAVETAESDALLRGILPQVIPFATAISILIFYVYALQCMSTIAVMKRETGGWKYPIIAFGYTFALAYGTSATVYAALNYFSIH